jgi:hypothetical protein
VAADHRDACVEAINSFKADHAADMVVCSRLADYQQLQARLNLSATIRIQPLTPTQIDDHLASFGTPLADLRRAVATDDEWRELAQFPLMLNLMAYTYSEATLPEGTTLADKRRQLLATYIQRTRANRPLPPDNPYDEAAALRWLHSITAQLKAHDQTVFYIERLQPSWLPKPQSFRWLFGLSSVLIFGLIGGLGGGVLFGLSDKLLFGLIAGLIYGLVVGMNTNIGQILSDSRSIELIEKVRLYYLTPSLLWQRIKQGRSPEKIFGLVVIIHRSMPSQQPNQGIRKSWRNAWFAYLFYVLIYGMLFGLLVGISNGLGLGLVYGLIGGLVGGFFSGMWGVGGQTVVQHYVLRWLLAWQGVLPFPFQDRKLIAYLDEMAARLLLRRVGGGWIFIHRTLLEFLADEAEFEKLMKDLGGVIGDRGVLVY